jgi:hypothetical protein
MLSRRALLQLLLASAAAEALDVERLLWVPKPIVTVPAPAFQFDLCITDVCITYCRQVQDIKDEIVRIAMIPSAILHLPPGVEASFVRRQSIHI